MTHNPVLELSSEAWLQRRGDCQRQEGSSQRFWGNSKSHSETDVCLDSADAMHYSHGEVRPPTRQTCQLDRGIWYCTGTCASVASSTLLAPREQYFTDPFKMCSPFLA